MTTCRPATLSSGRALAAWPGMAIFPVDDPRVIITTPEQLPVIFDGGCGVVTVEYDVSTAAFLQVSCIGVA
jgi:hypothetical protein